MKTRNHQMEIGMLNLQEETPKDINEIYEINKRAFGEEVEGRVVNALREADELILSLVAKFNNITIGYIAFSEVKINSGEETHKPIGLGPMAILPEYQRKGYGTKLVEQGLKILSERDYEIVVVLGHPDFYSQFGFVPSKGYGIQCEYECPPEAFMVKELKPGALKGITGKVYYSSKFNEV